MVEAEVVNGWATTRYFETSGVFRIHRSTRRTIPNYILFVSASAFTDVMGHGWIDQVRKDRGKVSRELEHLRVANKCSFLDNDDVSGDDLGFIC